VTHLKGGHVMAIRAKIDGETKEIRNEDGRPLTFIIEDALGEVHELFLTVGRMGTYGQFTLPPFQISKEGDFGDRAEAQQQQKTRVQVAPSKAKSVV
jgi:hypothetical protein